jgi:hypothetical protein
MSGLVPRPVSVVLAVVLMWIVMILGLVSVFLNANSTFGVFDLMDLLHLSLVGFFMLILAPLAVLVWRRRNLARLIYVAVSVFGVSADIGGISGDGRVELGCFIGSMVSSALLYLPASNRWFRVA